MDRRLSSKAEKELRLFVEGESSEISTEVLQELKTFATPTKETLFRGLFFDSKEIFEERFGVDSKSIALPYKIFDSFSKNEDVARSFAEDIESNYGVVVALELNCLCLDLSLFPEVLEDFDHEQEIVTLEEGVVEGKIIFISKDRKTKLGLS